MGLELVLVTPIFSSFLFFSFYFFFSFFSFVFCFFFFSFFSSNKALISDNCHTTPIHVGRFMLDAARQEKRNIFIFAELFSGSPEKDRIFVKEFGIHCLVREAMAAHDPKELSHMIHRNGGNPICSTSANIEFVANQSWASDTIYDISGKSTKERKERKEKKKKKS